MRKYVTKGSLYSEERKEEHQKPGMRFRTAENHVRKVSEKSRKQSAAPNLVLGKLVVGKPKT
jgi:hypothetical protein